MVVNDNGELLAVRMTPGNVSDANTPSSQDLPKV
ncbi:hypothetical protein IPL85_00595 [Candidatus Saccharibacteria bacterium]|nr:MAG: hypothetical protein IPL85_00595 [Candidatus Saccharibacteria bacterium]